MKRTFLAFLLCLVTGMTAFAADGYKIQIKFTDVKDSLVYLAHYYGKPLPTIYKLDSAKMDKNGLVTMQSKEKLLGGIYIILLSDKATYFELLLNNGDNMTINATAKQLPQSLKFTGSPENDRFSKYMAFLTDFSNQTKKLEAELQTAATRADTMSIAERGKALNKQLSTYREDYVKKYPGTLLANIFRAIKVPVVPEGKHYLEDGKTEDTMFAYNYYRTHYWDDFDFTDDRLIHTPIYDGKLDEYFNRLLPPTPDTINAEADKLLAKARGRKELFKYTLHWVTQWAQNSKIMGLDEVFVYMVENYHMKGDAYWMDNELLAKYIDRAQKVAPNVIGNLAPEIKMQTVDGKPMPMSAVNAKYTLVIFWSPECGHCQTEMPKIDSVYRAVLKDKGVKIYAVRTEGEQKLWTDFITKHKLQDWIHVWDPEHKSTYKSQYDVYATPAIYFLDEKKIIRGKKLDHTNITVLLDILENKQKSAAKGK